MKRFGLALVGTLLVAALAIPALGIGSGDGRKVLDFKTLAGVTAPYTGANPIRGLTGGGLPWEIADANGSVRADGRVKVEVEGLVLARRAPVPTNLQGTNPIPRFGAIVSCLTTVGGAATTANLATSTAPASSAGDAELDTTVNLPSPCFAPIVFVTTPGGAWLAVSGL